VLVVDPETWEKAVDVEVTDRETGNGYRYYRINPDGSLEWIEVGRQ
jgi:hypothetical protein